MCTRSFALIQLALQGSNRPRTSASLYEITHWQSVIGLSIRLGDFLSNPLIFLMLKMDIAF